MRNYYQICHPDDVGRISDKNDNESKYDRILKVKNNWLTLKNYLTEKNKICGRDLDQRFNVKCLKETHLEFNVTN